MNRSQWGACIAVGSSPLIISAILKLTPDIWVKKLGTVLLNEDEEVNNQLLSGWKSTQAGPDSKENVTTYNELASEKSEEADEFAQAP